MADAIKRKVTEADFRVPEFREADPDDYEFRDDGKVVRKDRWKNAIYSIASVVELSARDGFEVADVVEAARNMAVASARYEALSKLTPIEFNELYLKSCESNTSFDRLVDELPKQGDFNE